MREGNLCEGTNSEPCISSVDFRQIVGCKNGSDQQEAWELGSGRREAVKGRDADLAVVSMEMCYDIIGPGGENPTSWEYRPMRMLQTLLAWALSM